MCQGRIAERASRGNSAKLPTIGPFAIAIVGESSTLFARASIALHTEGQRNPLQVACHSVLDTNVRLKPNFIDFHTSVCEAKYCEQFTSWPCAGRGPEGW